MKSGNRNMVCTKRLYLETGGIGTERASVGTLDGSEKLRRSQDTHDVLGKTVAAESEQLTSRDATFQRGMLDWGFASRRN